MGWDVAAVGTLAITTEQRLAWKKAALSGDSGTFKLRDDFPQGASGASHVEALLARIRRDVELRSMAHTSSRFTLRALLPKDAYFDLAGDLVRAFAAAAAFGARGDLVVAGWLTAAPGLAFRLVVGPTVSFERLSRADEKRVTNDPRMKSVETMVDEHLRAADAAHRAAQPPGAYCLGIEHLRPLVDRALGVLDRADDAALLDAVRRENSVFLAPKSFPTAAAVRAECRGAHPRFHKPAARTSALLLVAARLDPDEGVALARAMIDLPPLDRPLWGAAVALLAPSAHAELLLERLRIEEVAAYGFVDREQWARPLARSKTIRDEALVGRLHEALGRTSREPDQACVAVAVASALLDRKVAAVGPAIARARFQGGSETLARELGRLLAAKPTAITVGNAPPLAKLEGLSLIQESTRRLELEPKAVYDEIGSALEAGDHAMTHAALLVVGRNLQAKHANKVFEADARWVAWLASIGPTVDAFYLDWLRAALTAAGTRPAKAALHAIRDRTDG